jgi:hypothetical protein
MGTEALALRDQGLQQFTTGGLVFTFISEFELLCRFGSILPGSEFAESF